ncbi:unnamed protein product [Meloidogyne enterolobii]|uniref:Uncharacterized protein n=1 Tax=Meloidogyne enterolobii TaxID=390850 RepID=A0ACB1AVH3_MELEN
MTVLHKIPSSERIISWWTFNQINSKKNYQVQCVGLSPTKLYKLEIVKSIYVVIVVSDGCNSDHPIRKKLHKQNTVTVTFKLFRFNFCLPYIFILQIFSLSFIQDNSYMQIYQKIISKIKDFPWIYKYFL